MHRRFARPLLIAVVIVLAGCTPAARGPEEVQVTLSEFKFQSSRTSFSAAVPYRFVLKNVGNVAHEWMVMPAGERDEAKALAEVHERELGSGRSVTKEFTFPRAGNYEFACHVPGHYEGGMVLPIVVN